MITYGVTQEEASRFGLPCGGTLRLVQEPLRDTAWVAELLARTADHELVARTLVLSTGAVRLSSAVRGQAMQFDGVDLEHGIWSQMALAADRRRPVVQCDARLWVGLALGARTPAEIAVSIVAEMLQVKNSAAHSAATASNQAALT